MHHEYLRIMHTVVPLYLLNDDIVLHIYCTAVKLLQLVDNTVVVTNTSS
jgi:hypothetical protein